MRMCICACVCMCVYVCACFLCLCMYLCVCICVYVCNKSGAYGVSQHLYGPNLIFKLLFVDNLESPGIHKCQQVFFVTHSDSVPIRTPSYINIFASCSHRVCTLTGWKERDVYNTVVWKLLDKNILITINVSRVSYAKII